MSEGRVLQLPPQQPVPPGGGDGDGTNYRIRALEEAARELRQDLKGVDSRLGQVERDLAGIKERLNHMATREDIQKLAAAIESKLSKQLKWILGTSSVLVVGAAGVIVRLLTLVNQ